MRPSIQLLAFAIAVGSLAQPYTTFTKIDQGATPPSVATDVLAASDWNLDGYVDVMVSGIGVYALTNGGTGVLTTASCATRDLCPIAAGNFNSLSMLDLNHDGFPDLVGSSSLPAAGPKAVGAFYHYGIADPTFRGLFIGDAAPGNFVVEDTATCFSVPGFATVSGDFGTASVSAVMDLYGKPITTIRSGDVFLIGGLAFGPGCRVWLTNPPTYSIFRRCIVFAAADDYAVVMAATDDVETGATGLQVLVEPVANQPGVSSVSGGITLIDTNGVGARPVIFDVTPPFGGGGETVIVTGFNFKTNQGAGSVTVSGFTASIVAWSDTAIVATVPAGPPSGDLVVRNGNLDASDPFYFGVTSVPTSAPTSVGCGSPAPDDGSPTIAIGQSASGFGPDQGYVIARDKLSLSQEYAEIVSWSANQVVVKMPVVPGATSASFEFQVGGWYRLASTASATLDLDTCKPRIQSVTATCPNGTNPMTITGADFGPGAPSDTTSYVQFPGGIQYLTTSPAIVSWSRTQIVVKPGAAVTSGLMWVHRSPLDGNQVYFNAASDITNVDPWFGIEGSTVPPVPGTQVTIDGGPFGATPAGKVRWNGGATSVFDPGSSNTQIRTKVPPGARDWNARSAAGIVIDYFGTRGIVAGDDTGAGSGLRLFATEVTQGDPTKVGGTLVEYWWAGLPSTGIHNVAAGDTNNDGVDDVLDMPQSGGGLVLYANGGFGSFTAVPAATSGLPSTGNYRHARFADLNYDLYNDLLAIKSGASDQVEIYFGIGNNQFVCSGANTFVLDAAASARAFTIDDFDSDGNLDIAVLLNDTAAVKVKVYVGALTNAAPTCNPPTPPYSFTYDATIDVTTSAGTPRAITSADMDDNGNADLVVAYDSKVDVYSGGGETHITQGQASTTDDLVPQVQQ